MFPQLGKVKWKFEMHDFEYEIILKNIYNYHPRAHFIVNNNSSLVFTLLKAGQTSSTTRLLLIRTSSD